MIIGIVGKARSGKDTCAAILAEELHGASGKRFVLIAYAQELKLRVQKDFDLTWDQLWGDQKEVPDPRYFKPIQSAADPEPNWTPREIMQHYGEFYRSIDSNFWVKTLFNKIEDKEFQNVIITDVRHPNEADPIVERGGYIIKVTSNRSDKEKIHGSQHISETAMDDYSRIDFHIRNDGTMQELQLATRAAMQELIVVHTKREKMEAQNG
jgi:hypothetical protein